MAAHGRPPLRDLFDDAPTPHIAHPPQTHRREFYVATDGSFRDHGDGGLGAVIETYDGRQVARLSLPDRAPDNNVAEYRALHLGLDVLAERSPSDARVGILLDHDELAANINVTVLGRRLPGAELPRECSIPTAAEHHWRGILARLAGFGEVRAARIDGDYNPAHPLANAPEQYAHVNETVDRCPLPWATHDDTPAGVPPPSRSTGRQPQASD
ncbi:MAG: ribonuclease HI [Salinarchaeum sp.]